MSAKSTRFASKRRSHRRLRGDQPDHGLPCVDIRRELELSLTEDARTGVTSVNVVEIVCVVEVALDHAATVAICVGTASMTGVAISAIASVCI